MGHNPWLTCFLEHHIIWCSHKRLSVLNKRQIYIPIRYLIMHCLTRPGSCSHCYSPVNACTTWQTSMCVSSALKWNSDCTHISRPLGEWTEKCAHIFYNPCSIKSVFKKSISINIKTLQSCSQWVVDAASTFLSMQLKVIRAMDWNFQLQRLIYILFSSWAYRTVLYWSQTNLDKLYWFTDWSSLSVGFGSHCDVTKKKSASSWDKGDMEGSILTWRVKKTHKVHCAGENSLICENRWRWWMVPWVLGALWAGHLGCFCLRCCIHKMGKIKTPNSKVCCEG